MLNLNINTNGGGGGGYVESIITLNSDQPNTVELSTDIVASASMGDIITASFVTTQSAAPVGKLIGRLNSEYEITVSGSGDWSAIEQEIDFSPTETASLVTLRVEVPKFGIDVSSQTTSSVVVNFEETQPYRRFAVNQSVKVDNPDLFIEYLAVGGGANGSGGSFNTGGAGSGGGQYFTGSVKLKMDNSATINAIVGGAGNTGSPTQVTFIENDGNAINIFASGGLSSVTPFTGGGSQQCGAAGILWLNDLPVGWNGNAGLNPPATPCPPIPTSSLIPGGFVTGVGTSIWENHPGKGGDGGGSCGGNTSCRTNGGPAKDGTFAFRYYNPKGLITFDAEKVASFTVGDYQYHFMAPGVNTISLKFPEQQYPPQLDEDVVEFIEAANITDANTINALDNFVVDLKEYGLWDKMEALYPFAGGTENSHKYNLKDARDTDDAYRIDFTDFTHSTGSGIVPNLPTGFGGPPNPSADTHYVRSGNINDIAMSYWTTLPNELNTTGLVMGVSVGSQIYAVGLNSSASTSSATLRARFGEPITLNANVGANTGMILGQRISGNSLQVYYNGSLKSSGGSNNLTGWPTNASVNLNLQPQQMIFAHIGKSMTEKQTADFYGIVRNLQKSLGRI
jgi:hypothetical protein